MKNALQLIAIMGLLIITCSSCKKTTYPAPQNVNISGSWVEPPTQILSRKLEFGGTGVFKNYITIKDNNNTELTIYTGSYQLNGDKLTVSVTEKLYQRNTEPAVKTAVNFSLFEQCTYSVNERVLVLNYISYPADAPVATKMTLLRETMSID